MTADLLDHARSLIERQEGSEGVWPRAAALLTRQVLEDALDRLWLAIHPGVASASRATQLTCLGLMITDAGLVADARSAWASLSRACHHHHYELGPTAAELERWIRQTEHLVRTLQQSPASDA
ncbi:MAG: hypothetical protein OXS29_04290 [bacterium]|nr:hypothetical protein [bacterium]MDE0290622.1 hypothetical protein [bacterium]MDE0439075.1 hypothetical protein [bacterium]